MMIISDFAMREIDSKCDSLIVLCRSALLSIFGRSSRHRLPEIVAERQASGVRTAPTSGQAPASKLRLVSRPASPEQIREPEMRWQRHPQLRSRPKADGLAGSKRSARIEAERGMILARGGKFTEAVEAFTRAAADHAVELEALPGFWDMPRQSMMTAVAAYEHVDRIRDAAALQARIRHTLRPRALSRVRNGTESRGISASGA